MTRPGLPTFAALALAAMLACAGRPDGAKPTRDDGGSAAKNFGAKPAARSSDRPDTPATHLVAIAPDDASPCEQMCGQVGDCLQSEESIDAAATGIEFACLDACVFADPDLPAAREFLACGAAGSCSEVLGCARAHWDDASAARAVSTSIGTITVNHDICESACVAIGACSYVGNTPRDLGGSVDAESYVRQCTESCRQNPETEQMWAPIASCSNSSNCLEFNDCQMRGYNPSY